MKKLFESTVVLLLLLCIAGVAQATPITIVNASFEDGPSTGTQTYSNGDGSWYYSANGWVITSGTLMGTYNPSNTFDSIPNGEQIAFTNSPAFYQTLSTTLSSNTLYTLSAYVGWRNDVDTWSGYTMELWAGDSIIASISAPTPEKSDWELTTLTYTSRDVVTTGQLLKIRVDNLGSSQINFDMFSLDATALSSSPVPEPGTMFLFGIGLLGLAGASRRKK